ncbi:MAG: hypothetical protein AAGI45_13190 [Cyanobacteria bacterium P01_H01_bin.26]
MFQDFTQGTQRPTVYSETDFLPEHEYETVRHLLLGSLNAVQNTIKDLHSKRYADPNDWSRPLATGRPNEVMAILTRNVRVD